MIFNPALSHELVIIINNYVVLNELKEFKDCESLRTNITKTARIVLFSIERNYLFIIQQ